MDDARRATATLLQQIDRLDLVDHVAPIQLAIRLLIPEGSRMLELDDVRAAAGASIRRSLTIRGASRSRASTRCSGAGGLVGVQLTARAATCSRRVGGARTSGRRSPPPLRPPGRCSRAPRSRT